MIRSMVKEVYDATQTLKDAKKDMPKLAPSKERYNMAAAYLNMLLHTGRSRIESVTLIGTCLSNKGDKRIKHRDHQNYSLQPYWDHEMFNVYIWDSYGGIWLLQLGLYFHDIVGQYCIPQKNPMKEILLNLTTNVKGWQQTTIPWQKRLKYQIHWARIFLKSPTCTLMTCFHGNQCHLKPRKEKKVKDSGTLQQVDQRSEVVG